MALDESRLRQIIREERESAKREDEAAAREKARDDRLAELEKKVAAKPDKEEDPDAHEFAE
jgi:hypothetical protein